MFDDYGADINFYNDYFYILAFLQVMYLPTIYFIYNYMKDKQPINCKVYMGIWNCLLSIFSSYCFHYIVNPLIFSQYTLHDKICTDVVAYENKELNRWRTFFVLSKFPEMIDTVWIALRKRKLSTLQLWHHFSVCLYCWLIVLEKTNNTYENSIGGHGTFFAAMNSCVHMFMYGYYAVVSLTTFRSNSLAQTITQFQTLQMLIGIIILMYRTYNCDGISINCETIFSYIMYWSYLYLFVSYYISRYFVIDKNKIKSH